MALAPGDRFVLRRGPTQPPIGGVVLDVTPPRGVSRRRQTPARVAVLAAGRDGARLDLHGALTDGGRTVLAPDVRAIAGEAAIAAVPETAGLGSVRAAVAATLRRVVTMSREQAMLAATPGRRRPRRSRAAGP